MQLFDFIALVLAIRDIVDVWKNGSIFAERRAIVEAHDGEEVVRTWRRLPYNVLTGYGLLWELLVCAYCLSRQVALWLALGICFADFLPLWLAALIRTIVYGFAAAQVSWMANNMLPERWQYDRDSILPEVPNERIVDEPAQRNRPRNLLRRDVQTGNGILPGLAAGRARARLARHRTHVEDPVGPPADRDHRGAGDVGERGGEPPTGPGDQPDADGPEQPDRSAAG